MGDTCDSVDSKEESTVLPSRSKTRYIRKEEEVTKQPHTKMRTETHARAPALAHSAGHRILAVRGFRGGSEPARHKGIYHPGSGRAHTFLSISGKAGVAWGF